MDEIITEEQGKPENDVLQQTEHVDIHQVGDPVDKDMGEMISEKLKETLANIPEGVSKEEAVKMALGVDYDGDVADMNLEKLMMESMISKRKPVRKRAGAKTGHAAKKVAKARAKKKAAKKRK